jgi:hypothetical protein
MTGLHGTMATIDGGPCTAHFRDLVNTLAGVVCELGARAGHDAGTLEAIRLGYTALQGCRSCREAWFTFQRLQWSMVRREPVLPAGRG